MLGRAPPVARGVSAARRRVPPRHADGRVRAPRGDIAPAFGAEPAAILEAEHLATEVGSDHVRIVRGRRAERHAGHA